MAVPFAVDLPIVGRKLSPAKQAKLSRQLRLIQARSLAVSIVQKRRRKKRLPVKLGRQQQPDHIRRQYRAALVAIFAEAHAVTRRALEDARPEIEAAAAAQRKDGLRGDAAGQPLQRVAKAFFDAFPNTLLARVARRFADLTSDYQKAQIIEQFKAVVGINIFGGIVEDWLPARVNDFVEKNVSLIRSLAHEHFDDLRSHLTEGIAAGRRWEEIATEIGERYDVADRHAELIARDQVGKFYGALNEERQTELGVLKYVWRTARDNRVRDAHFEREGKAFSWDDPPEDGHPGEAINCRCQAEPDLAGLLETIG
jgi:SPP1 gp7 family putative phage head morphogenesis protein